MSSKVQVCNSEFDTLENDIIKAYDTLEDAQELWGTNFDNLLNNIVTSGYLNSLYEDAESNWHIWMGTIHVVAGIAAFAAALVTPVGWVALALAALGAIFGIGVGAFQIAKEPDWYTVSKEVFAQLLYDCACGNDDSYIHMTNIGTKLYNTSIGLEKIKSKINEFQQLYADLTATIDASSLKGKAVVASDGVTVLGIKTFVTIDGKEVETTVSDALNAFYTYNETVMNAEIEADYLSRTYGIDINYEDIVKNANAFMTKTINSGLYSHEFIEGVLPGETVELDKAKQAAIDKTGLSMDQVNAALNNNSGLLGTGAIAAGLLGLPLLGTLVTSPSDTGAKPGGTTPGGTTPGGSNPGGSNPGGSNPGGSNPGGSNPGGNNPGGNNPGNNDNNDDKKDDTDKGNEDEKKPVNDVKIPEIVDGSKLPEELESTYEVDYDKLAREQFEFEQDFDDIMEDRAKIIADVESKYDNGDMDSLKTQLTEFGYNDAEVEAIIASKFLTSKAILEGTQRAELAQRAEALAQEAGVKDFKSKYSERPNFKDLSEEEASEELMLSSGDKKVTDAYDKMKEAREDYSGKVKDANEALLDVNENKKAVDEIRAKYEKEFGEDTSQWSEEAANEYKEAIDKYNESVETANQKVEDANTAQKEYESANGEFEKAKEDFYKNGGSSEDDNQGNVDNASDGTTGGATGGMTGDVTQGSSGDKPVFQEPTNYSTDGITIDSGAAASTGTPTGTTAGFDPMLGPNNTLNMGAAMMSLDQQILNSLEEKDGELIQH